MGMSDIFMVLRWGCVKHGQTTADAQPELASLLYFFVICLPRAVAGTWLQAMKPGDSKSGHAVIVPPGDDDGAVKAPGQAVTGRWDVVNDPTRITQWISHP